MTRNCSLIYTWSSISWKSEESSLKVSTFPRSVDAMDATMSLKLYILP